MQAWKPKDYIAPQVVAFPGLLNRFLAARIQLAVVQAVPALLSASESSHAERSEATFTTARLSFQEQITWRELLRGQAQLTEKETADKLGIWGLQNSADSASRPQKGGCLWKEHAQ